MKKIFLILTVIFVILTFAGAVHVLYNNGAVNAGYACVPMILALACLNFYRNARKN